MLEKIVLVAADTALYAAWAQTFADIDAIETKHGDLFEVSADALVSPANSFGIMDGGLDLAIRDVLGFEVEKRVQQAILDRFHGEMPVGSAIVVPTDHAAWKYLISAPTMRVPEDVSGSLNSYLAFRAVLVAVRDFNSESADPIRSLVCPGLGTGIGNIPPRKCAVQMRIAHRYVSAPSRIPSYREIHDMHRKMKSAF